MTALNRFISFCRNVFNRKQGDADLSEELREYERLLTDENIRAGMSETDARRSALISIGGVELVKENVRAVRSGAWIEGLMQDLRYGFRSLIRVPVFTTTAVIALALGIGASTAIFSVVNGVLLKPLPYREPERIVTLLHEGSHPVAPANFLDWRASSKSFVDMAAAELWSPNISGAGNAERVLGLHVTPNMIPMLGVAPILGHMFGPETGQVGRDREVVIGFDIWQRRFGGDSTIIGRTVLLNGNGFKIVGVMPRTFAFAPFWAVGAQLWAPIAFGDRALSRNGNSLRIFARLAPHATLEQAQLEINAVTSRLEILYPRTNRNVIVTPLMEQATRGMQRPLIVLLVAVCFLLVAACANVAHMMLARSSSRQREMAVRTALGASRGKLTRQLLCESLILSTTGGLLGLVIAIVGTRTLVALGSAAIPRVQDVHFDLRVLAVTSFISIATGVLFGLAPARNAIRTDLVSSLKDGGRSENGGSANMGFRHVLVASQFAIALTLLIGAGLMMRTLAAMHNINPGFSPRGVLSAIVSATGTAADTAGRREQFFTQTVNRIASLPGVRSVSAINHLPIAGDVWGQSVSIEGQAELAADKRNRATYRVVLPAYFKTMGIPLLKGRDITNADRVGSHLVVIVNARFAEHFWPNESAVGKRFMLGDIRTTVPEWMTVVGVSKNTVISGWTDAPDDEIYVPYLQSKDYLGTGGSHFAFLTFVIKTDGDATLIAPSLRATVTEINPSAPVSDVQSLDSVVEGATADRKFYLVLLSAFAIAALVLAGVGIYGVMSHAVARRMHEMGVRIALGASSSNVLRLVVGRGMLVVVSGAALGVAGALALTKLMDTLLYGVKATDPVTFGSVTAFLLVVALVACWIPARRATRIDPLTALRGD
ncbi:MAG: ABC transporter permease [Gemmatimonadaceae bacterium]